MGLRTRAVGLGASAATATGLVGWWARARLGLGTRRIRSPRRLRSALGTSARLVAAPLQLLGLLGTTSVRCLLPGVEFLAVRDVDSAARPAVRSSR
jgi:hypothetical protein